MEEEIFQKLFGKQAFYSFLRSRKKPLKGEEKVLFIPDQLEKENDIDYKKKVFKETGVRITMTGPLKMPGPNSPCPCKATYPDGKPKKFKICCGRDA